MAAADETSRGLRRLSSPDAQDIAADDIDEKQGSGHKSDQMKKRPRDHTCKFLYGGNSNVNQKNPRESKKQDRAQTDISADVSPIPDFCIVIPEPEPVKQMKEDPAGQKFKDPADRSADQKDKDFRPAEIFSDDADEDRAESGH